MAAPSLESSMQHHVTLRNPITHYSTKSFGIKFGWNFKRFPNHWNKVWFRARLLLLNKHFARKNYVLIFYLVWISLNMSISVVVLHEHAWNKCITMSPRWGNHAKPPPKFILRNLNISLIPPRLGGLPHLETFTWQNLTLAERVTWSGRPGYPPWRVTPPIM